MELMLSVEEAYPSLVPYGVLVFNTLFFGLLRRLIGRPLDPNIFQWIAMEFAATLEFCVDCNELAVISEMHGTAAMGATLFILCIVWGRTWFKAAATPCDPIEDLVCRQDHLKTIVARLCGQMLAAMVAQRYSCLIWSFNVIPEHEKLHQASPDNPLQVSMLMGFLVEATITLISRFVQLETGRMEGLKVDFINAATSVMLVIAATDSTGGFFNPALATALKIHCRRLPYKDFLVVYWLAAIIGDLTAHVIHAVIHKVENRVSQALRRRASTPANSHHQAANIRKSSH